MILKLSLFTTFFATVVVGAAEVNTRFSVENVWTSSKGDGTSKPYYIDGIQQYYDDIIESFSKFPSGPLLNEAEIVMATFQNFLAKLVIFSYSNSTVLSSSSAAILETLNQVNVSVATPLGVIEEFQRILPTLMQSYRTVVANLSDTIGGDVFGFVNVAMTDLELSFKDHMTEFLQNDHLGLKKSVDFKPIARHAQTLSSTISLIAATMQSRCESGELQGALMTLTLVLDHLMICFHGLSGCSQAVLSEQNSGEPFVVLEFYSTLGVFTSGITNSLDANNIRELSTSLTKFTDVLNSTFNNLFGAFESVAGTAEEIAKNISNNISGAVCGITNKLTEPLGGLGQTNPLGGLGRSNPLGGLGRGLRI